MRSWPTSSPPSWGTCRWPPRRPPAIWSRPTCRRRTICAASAPTERPCWPAATCWAIRADRHRLGAVVGAAARGGPGRGAAAGAGRLPRPRTHSRWRWSAATLSCWTSRCAPPPPIPTPSPTPSARWSATPWPAATPTLSRCTGWCRR
jgi:hypothetical protein